MSLCHYIQAQAGDGCYALAQRCSITQNDLTKYNPSNGFCDSIKVGDYVCCSAGSLPDFSPKKGSDGSCFAYTAQGGDTCSGIASAHSLADWHKIDDWNHNTWGWAGCDKLQVGARFCLSDGTPPFPQALDNAVCGPQVKGTQQPSNMSSRSWGDLNPCPLNACCDIWGQCGTTPDFCTWSLADTWAPGTAKTGQNGCISNCGTTITNNNAKPDQVRRIGYFEAWNGDRDCLKMDISDFDTNTYDHVHFAFANLTDTWDVDVSQMQDQFQGLLQLTNVKRILSFGGWTFSTSARTHSIFREGVKEANRFTFASKVVNYIKFVGLDGVDFDWEYPGETDIKTEGVEADSPDSGENYLEFLRIVRYMLPPDKTLSIAAPASYWYLKNFPIAEISKVVDYIVYMTYDLHGQWDYANKWVDPGCDNGDCLRHHTNDTEVQYALSMITKAGIPSGKIIVGMPLYGRSFKMVEPLCSAPFCKYTGPASGALPGRCTKTPGYIANGEIRDIINTNGKMVQYYDQGDILVYNDTEWVSWMADSTYLYKRNLYVTMNFGGTVDWAVDLDGVLDDGTIDGYDNGYDNGNYNETFDSSSEPSCDAKYTNIDDVNKDQNDIPMQCLQGYLLDALIAMWEAGLSHYQDLVNNGYDSKFSTYADYISDQVPGQLEKFMLNSTNTQGTVTAALVDGGAAVDPPDYCDFRPGLMGDEKQNTHSHVAYTLTDSDTFFYRLGNATGILKDWVELYTYDRKAKSPCPASTDKLQCTLLHEVVCDNLPQKTRGTVTVPNPKDTISKSLDQSQDMLKRLKIMQQLQVYDKSLDPSDLVDAASMPVLTFLAAVDQMDQAASEGEQLQEEKRKEIIMAFITGLLFFIPFAGEAAGAVGMTTVRLTMQLLDVAGNLAFTVYGVVTDKDNVMGDIFAALFAAGLAHGAWSKAADARRAMTIEDISKLGVIKQHLGTISSAQGRMCRL